MRKKWGKAKRQVELLAADLRVLSAAGLNLEETFVKLSRDGRLDVGRSTFKRHASAILKNSEFKNSEFIAAGVVLPDPSRDAAPLPCETIPDAATSETGEGGNSVEVRRL